VKLLTDVRNDNIQLKIQALPTGRMGASALLMTLQFARSIAPPNELVLTVSQGGHRSVTRTPIDHNLLADPPSDELIQFIDDLALIQDATHSLFPVPDTFTQADARLARKLRRLFDGASVPWRRGPMKVSVFEERIDEFTAQFADHPRALLGIMHDDIEAEIAGEVIHTGPVFISGQVKTSTDIVRREGDDVPSAVFDTLGDGWMYAQAGVPEGLPPDDATRHEGAARVVIAVDRPPEEASEGGSATE
jgi:hypothetical protein